MTKRTFLAFCFGFCFALPALADLSTNTKQKLIAEGRFYQKDYASAAKNSRDTGRNLIVLVSASWCGPCNQLKSDIAKADNEDTLPKGVNIAVVDYNSDIGKKLSVSNSIPQLIRFERKQDGKWYKSSSIGYLSPSKFKEFCNGEK
jgi:thiol-disulfide isomerase/thioredoxin